MAQIKGIDISGWQGNIGALGSDIGFVIIKASEGTGYVNPYLAEQRNTARSSHKLVGYYHFSDLSDPVAEANHFVAAVGTLEPGEFLALDWETGNYSDAVDAWAATFVKTVHAATGVIPMLYSNAARINSGAWPQTKAQNAGLWEAAYGANQPSPSPWAFAAIWQNSSSGSEQGVSGNVDTDYFMGDIATLEKYGAGGTVSGVSTPPSAAPAPAPMPQPSPAPAAGSVYVVQRGDTLSGIAAKYGTTYQHLAAINGIANPSLIYAGQRITVGAVSSRTYTVVGGDTLSGIAARYGTTWQVLQSLNAIPNANLIHVGQVLRLP